MERKIYETLGKRTRLSIPLTLGDRIIRVEFSNGGLMAAGNGRYMTCDKEIQDALESNPAYKKSYILKDVVKMQSQPIEQTESQASQEPKKISEEVETNTENDTLQFANFNELRDYLITNHNCSAASVRSMSLAMTQVKKLGITVEITK